MRTTWLIVPSMTQFSPYVVMQQLWGGWAGQADPLLSAQLLLCTLPQALASRVYPYHKLLMYCKEDQT